MTQNKNRHLSSTTRRLRRLEEKIDIIISDYRRIQERLNSMQWQINSRNRIEMDMALQRLQLSAMSMKEIAKKEAQEARKMLGQEPEAEIV